MTEDKKPETDWSLVAIDYRAGIKSLRQIGIDHGVSHTAVKKRATAEGWTRDLSAAIKAKADEKVSKAAVSSEVSMETRATEKAVVEANAEVQFQVRMRHRTDLRRLRDLFDNLLQEIVAETADPDLFEELGEMLRAPDDKGQDKRNDLYMKVIGRSARVDDTKKLTDLFEKLVRMEREAFGIDRDEGAASPLDEMLKRVAAAEAAQGN